MNIILKIFYYLILTLVWIIAIPILLGIGGVTLISLGVMIVIIILFSPIFMALGVDMPTFSKKRDRISLTLGTRKKSESLILSATKGVSIVESNRRSSRRSKRSND